MIQYTQQSTNYSLKGRLIDMLVLNRKMGESIILGENIEIRILDIQDGKIKIGIEAPREVSILRKEVYEAIKAENEASINVGEDILDILKGIK